MRNGKIFIFNMPMNEKCVKLKKRAKTFSVSLINTEVKSPLICKAHSVALSNDAAGERRLRGIK